MKKNLKLHTMLEKFISVVLITTLICLSIFLLLFIFGMHMLSPLNITLLLILSIFVIILFGEIVLKKNHDKEH
jgi:drug/metabolite transporter (DMT)-like permease